MIREEGLTYIADRGDVAFDLFKQITDQSAFFIIRVKSSRDVVIKKPWVVDLPENWKGDLTDVKDSLVLFKGETNKRTYRIITFEMAYILGHMSLEKDIILTIIWVMGNNIFHQL